MFSTASIYFSKFHAVYDLVLDFFFLLILQSINLFLFNYLLFTEHTQNSHTNKLNSFLFFFNHLSEVIMNSKNKNKQKKSIFVNEEKYFTDVKLLLLFFF